MRRTALEEGRRWLEQAQEDLRWAKDLAERARVLVDVKGALPREAAEQAEILYWSL